MSSSLSNEQTIKLWRRRHSIQKRLDSNKAKAKRLDAAIERDHEYLYGINDDNFYLYHGILIDDTWGSRISAVSNHVTRDGEWWLNAHNEKTYCFRLRWYENYRWNEEFMGHYWPDKDQVIKMIKNWIVLGTKPRSVPWRKGKRFSTYHVDTYLRKRKNSILET